jgi:polar amino acid transport system substrate-binding protein
MILSFIVFGNSHLSGTIISILGFSLIFGCGVYNNLKVGMGAIPIGQTEASRALGYSDTQSFFKILLPQAARHFLPIYKSNVVSLIKETSVVGYIAVMDLTKMGDLVRSRTYDPFFALIAVAIMYFVMEAVLVRIVNRVEFSIDPKRRPKEKILAGIEERE